MTHVAIIYGFGSYFNGRRASSNDIDILVLHQSLSEESISIAIQIKRLIAQKIPRAHIVMLSEQEEREVGIIRECEAFQLGRVRADCSQNGVADIASKVID